MLPSFRSSSSKLARKVLLNPSQMVQRTMSPRRKDDRISALVWYESYSYVAFVFMSLVIHVDRSDRLYKG